MKIHKEILTVKMISIISSVKMKYHRKHLTEPENHEYKWYIKS